MRVFLILYAAIACSWILEYSIAGAKESLSCLAYEILKGSKGDTCQMRGDLWGPWNCLDLPSEGLKSETYWGVLAC